MYLDDMTLNMELTTDSVTITREDMISFAKKYDPFRLHYDDAYAEKTRYGQLIAPGVMSFMSVWARIMESGFLGEELIAGKSTKIEWFKPVFAGDVLTGKSRVTNLQRRNRYNGIVELTTDIYNQHGELVLTDVTESIVQCRTE
ncbi:MAG: MaoC family dehydratase N-terminal domain-containing protein [Clostridium sp.]|nr:MaoC family dehydratase N-terminal domain-containing protein [Clostridium sp.]